MRATAAIALAAFLSGCGTLVTEPYIQFEAEGAAVVVEKPGYCGGAGASVTFRLAPDARVQVRNTIGKDLVSVELRRGDTFNFMSNRIRVLGQENSDMKVSISRLTILPIGPPTLNVEPTQAVTMERTYGGYLDGRIETGPNVGLSGLASWKQLEGLEIQLPDAIFNGQLVSFAKITLRPREVSYYQSRCWR